MADFVGSRAATTGTSATSFAFSPSATCNAGNTLVMAVGPGATTKMTDISVTDSQGNTWRPSSLAGTVVGLANLGLFIAYLATALSVSDTITVTTSGSAATWAVVVGEFTGIVAPADTEAPNDIGSIVGPIPGSGAGSYSVGPTTSTSYMSEIAVAAFVATGASITFSAGAGYTIADSTAKMMMEYSLLTSQGSQTASATLGGTINSVVAVLASYITDSPLSAPPPLIG